MSYPILRRLPRLAVCLLALSAAAPFARAQTTLEKAADFNNVTVNGIYQGGSSQPYDNSVQIGNRLWFTTNRGGDTGLGTISYYDLTTKQITAFVSLGANNTGNSPQSSLTAVGNTLYFTNSVGGTGGTGTLASVNTSAATPTVTTLYNFGATGTSSAPAGYLNPRNPGGSITAIANPSGGTDLYFTTATGGAGGANAAAAGTISRYNTATNTYSVVYNFNVDANSGRQPMEGFTNVGGKLYFTTFTGGANAPSSGNNGAGTLSVFDPSTGSVSVVASLVAGAGNGQFGSHNVLQGSNGLLYFTTVGSATNPGSLQSFNLSTGVLSTVYALSPAVNSIFPDGRFAYGSLLEFNKVLYFVTMAGGANARGAVDAFDLTTNTFTKLYDLDTSLGSGTRGGFTLVNENGVDYLYLLTNLGGANNQGTLLRLTPIPEPGTVALLVVTGTGGWLWRRRRRGANASLAVPVAARPVLSLGGNRQAFTLIELVIVISIVAVLAGVTFPVFRGAVEKGQETACASNLRQIAMGYSNYADDHNGYFPSGEAIGNSAFRRSDDPLGLPILFGPYIGTENTEDHKVRGLAKIWLCPAGRPSLKTYGNNYAWSISTNVLSKSSRAQDLAFTLLARDTIEYTLPSTPGVPEVTSGPTAPPAQYRFYPHRTHKKYNAGYADGHVAILP